MLRFYNMSTTKMNTINSENQMKIYNNLNYGRTILKLQLRMNYHNLENWFNPNQEPLWLVCKAESKIDWKTKFYGYLQKWFHDFNKKGYPIYNFNPLNYLFLAAM